MNLVVIPFHDWKKCEREGFRTRDAHFMQEFEKHPAVEKMLVINRPISLSEMILMRRNRTPKNGTIIFQKNNISITQVAEKTYTLDILILEIVQPIKMKRHWTSYIFGQEKVRNAVKMALAYLGMASSYALFVSAPIYVPLVEHLHPSVFAFDALDNFLKHSLYRDIRGLQDYYRFCLEHADFVSANSKETTEWFRLYRHDAVHIPNGVDDKMFNEKTNHTVPRDMSSLSSPIVGYAGKMQEMFDVSMMERVVKTLPNVSFVFIGQLLNSDWMKPLWKHSNVYYLGDKPYKYLPQYLSAFDICIIPYDINRQHGGDPIKFYEYMAMGKPVVTTNIGGVSAFKDYSQVIIADTEDMFINGVKSFVAKIEHGETIAKTNLPAECFWNTKADYLLQMIQNKI